MRPFYLALLAAILLLNAFAEDSHPAYRYGLIQASCAPWDGAAVDITLTTTPLACKRSPKDPS